MKRLIFLLVLVQLISISQIFSQDTLAVKELWTKEYNNKGRVIFTSDMNKIFTYRYLDNHIVQRNTLSGAIIDTVFSLPHTEIYKFDLLNDSVMIINLDRTKSDSIGGLMFYNLNTKKYRYIDSGNGSDYYRNGYASILTPNLKRAYVFKGNNANQFTEYISIFDFETWQSIKDTVVTKDPWATYYISHYGFLTDSLILRGIHNSKKGYIILELYNIYTNQVEKTVSYKKEEGAVTTISNSRQYLDLGEGSPKLIIRTSDLTVADSILNCKYCYYPHFVKSDRYLIYKNGNYNEVYDRELDSVIYKLNITYGLDGFSENGEFGWKNYMRLFKLNWDIILDVEEGKIMGNNLYPNPVSQGNIITINTDNEITNASLYDLLGIEYKIEINNNAIHLPESLSKGIYFLKYEADGKFGFEKVVVK